MAAYKGKLSTITPTRKSSSIGQGGRGRSVKIAMSTIEKAEGYLAHKWGRTSALPSDHPYKTSAPTG